MVSHAAGSLFYFVLTKEARQLHCPVFGLFQVLLEIDISHKACEPPLWVCPGQAVGSGSLLSRRWLEVRNTARLTASLLCIPCLTPDTEGISKLLKKSKPNQNKKTCRDLIYFLLYGKHCTIK